MGGSSSGGWSRLGDVKSLEQKAKAALNEGKRNVFISFATEDMREVNLLRAHTKNDNNDLEFNDHSVKEAYDSDQADYIKRKISERINRCSVTVVFISDDTAQSKWVKWEVEKSLELGKKVVAVHSGEKFSGTEPQWVSEHGIKTVPWANLPDELK
ncbi:TIR domain-containing protein [Pseudomonas syringae]|uniref:Molecular chaperone Tir n=1 Tax=Pseudomonas syringae pv. syringae TaxID=321 RepID=A0AAE5S3H1_PSESY|nr:TIR domain-containing protein [Pseudomonas syringae]POQ01235.1 molecular chaperone Tir [Pseudomonas syringae pv. syringae]